MASSQNIWFRIGHAYERARSRAPAVGKAVVRGRERRPDREGGERLPTELPWPSADDLLGAAAWLLLDRVAGSLGSRRRPGIGGLAKAALSGAAAALITDLLGPLLSGDGNRPVLDEGTVDRLIAGAGQGVLYGALVEPRVPGPALLKGAVYGSVEYATDPVGGLDALIGSHAPHGGLPVVGAVLEGMTPRDRAYFEHVVFGIALALLYEPDRSSSGIRSERTGGGG